nr:MAG TPA: hypothetical protein [Caudoviricetes sp.]
MRFGFSLQGYYTTSTVICQAVFVIFLYYF